MRFLITAVAAAVYFQHVIRPASAVLELAVISVFNVNLAIVATMSIIVLVCPLTIYLL